MYMLGTCLFTPSTHNDILYGGLAVWPKATRQACKCTIPNSQSQVPDLKSLILNAPFSEWQKPDCTSALCDAQGEGLLIQ